MKHTLNSCLAIVFLILPISIGDHCFAQITIDNNKIANPSILKIKNKKTNISGGTFRGKNLFHSFKEFSLLNSQKARFITNRSTKNIIIRVTGNKASILNGRINFSRPSSLLFINNNGIIAGTNFKTTNVNNLTLTTSSLIKFSDNFKLSKNSFIDESHSNSNVSNFLFSKVSNRIRINNSGSEFIDFPLPLLPIAPDQRSKSFNLPSDNEINIFSNGIYLNGAIIDENNSSINLISIKEGVINVEKSNNRIYKNSKLSNIDIDNQSFVGTRGPKSSINIIGDDLNIGSRSNIYLFNDKSRSEGININANRFKIIGSLKEISSFSSDEEKRSSAKNISGIFLVNQIKSKSNIYIKSNSVDVLSGAKIVNHGGDINLSSDKLLIDSVNSDFNTQDSFILIRPALLGGSGTLTVDSKNIEINDGGGIASSTFSDNDAGKVFINAKNIKLNSFNPITTFQSSISSVSLSKGNSNDVSISAQKLEILNGSTVTSASAGGGDTGRLTIDANRIDINGLSSMIPDTGISSIVVPATSNPVDPNTPLIPTNNVDMLNGKSGNVFINSKKLGIKNGIITVSNFSNREAGNLFVDSNLLLLNNGRITASSNNSDGGNINLKSNVTSLNNSIVSSSSTGTGLGGNIVSNSNLLTLYNSSIQANAQNNNAGNVKITSNLIIENGFNEITANSRLGTNSNGEVSITQRNSELRTIDTLPKVNDSPIAIRSTCSSESDNILPTNHGVGKEAVALSERQKKALYLKQRIDFASQFHYIDSKTGKKKPFKPLLAIEENDAGKLELIFSAEQSKGLKNLLSSLDNNCSIKS